MVDRVAHSKIFSTPRSDKTITRKLLLWKSMKTSILSALKLPICVFLASTELSLQEDHYTDLKFGNRTESRVELAV